MSILNFPEDFSVLVVDSSTEAYLGGFEVTTNQELGHIVLHMYKHGAHVGTEQFRLAIYTSEDRSDTPFYSETLDVSDITSMTSDGWKGRVRFDFDRQNINTVSTYHVTLDPVSYSRTGDTFYFGAVLDNPLTINTNNTPQAGAAMEVWGYR